jgi:hypothetical protein
MPFGWPVVQERKVIVILFFFCHATYGTVTA